MTATFVGQRRLSIILAGGGTGGHLFAGLAVAEQIQRLEPDARLTFLGTGKPWEATLVRRAGYAYAALPCCPWSGHSSNLGRFLWNNGRGFFAARGLLRRLRASVVVGLGGYASAPAARAAVHLGLPLVLIEPNAMPGRVTRWLAGQATAICVAFESAHHRLGGDRVVNTGAPARERFSSQSASLSGCHRAATLYITGGSLGAAALNQAVPHALRRVLPLLRRWRIVHQTGTADEQATRRRYAEAGISATVAAFVDPPPALAENDLAICRAGGLTLAELAATGTPAIIVPYPHACDDHQRHNAAAYIAAGACRGLEQTTLADTLPAALRGILSDADRRAAMSAAMRTLARPRAAADIAELVCRAGTPPMRTPAARMPATKNALFRQLVLTRR